MATATPSPRPAPLRRQLSHTSQQREQELLDWVLRKCNTDEAITLEEGWERIETHGIRVLYQVLKGENTESSPFGTRGYASLYTISYKLCSHAGMSDHSRALYDRHKECVEEYLRETVVPTVLEKHEEFLLKEFRDVWANHKLMTKWMWRLFMHLDRSVVVHNQLPTLISSSLRAFYDQVFVEINPRLRACILEFIDKDRNGEVIEAAELKENIQMYELMGMAASVEKVENLDTALKQPRSLHIYVEEFEASFLAATREYYQRMSQKWLSENDVPTYLELAETAVVQEEARCNRYLNSVTLPKLTKLCMEEMIVAHRATLIQAVKEVLASIHAAMSVDINGVAPSDLETLRRMFDLFHRTHLLDPDDPNFDLIAYMATGYKDYISNIGDQIIQKRRAQIEQLKADGKKETNSEPELIESFISLRESTTNMTKTIFNSNRLFEQAVKNAFTHFMNLDAGKIPTVEMLCAYVDRLLKGSIKTADEEELEEKLKLCIELFCFMTDKDMFAEIYRDMLSKRLLNKRSVSNDVEKSMIGRMKHICGAPFTSKLEGMLNDFAVGEDMHREFGEHLAKCKTEGLALPYDFQVQVLTTGFWPAQKLREINLPVAMSEGISVFSQWYTARFNHRLLKWVYTLGDVTIVGSYEKKKYNIVLTTIQGLVLMSFSGDSSVQSFEDVKQRLGIAEVEVLKRILHSLSCGKHKLLIKSPTSKSVSTNDTFQVNPKFTEKLRTFRVPMASLDDTNAAPAVHESRGFAIDAAIVRIMKARRRLSHNDLINEVFHQLRYFQPQPKMVKQRIEQLIEREYLKRDENDNKMYEYLP